MRANARLRVTAPNLNQAGLPWIPDTDTGARLAKGRISG